MQMGWVFFLAQPNLPFQKNLTWGDGKGIFLCPHVVKEQKYNSSEYIFVAVEFNTNNKGVDPNGIVDTRVYKP